MPSHSNPDGAFVSPSQVPKEYFEADGKTLRLLTEDEWRGLGPSAWGRGLMRKAHKFLGLMYRYSTVTRLDALL